MIRNTFIVLALTALTASSANAALIGSAIKVKDPAAGIPFNAPDAALPAPWVAYQLSISTTGPGELIGAVDVTITGNKLHQRWNDTDFDGVTNPSPQATAVANGRGDSHLTAPAGSPFGFGPTETNTLAGSPLTSTPGVTEYGLGNLSGAWALLTPVQSTNIAYLVFKSDDFAGLNIVVKAANPAGTPYNTLTGINNCLACVPPTAGDDVFDNIDANVPGLLERQLTIQVPSVDPVTLTNFSFESFTPPPGGPGTGPANPASLDSATRKFIWNTVGSPIGTYKWTYIAQNVWGPDAGSITVNITVPEPATCSLLALSLAGCLALIRRR